jgi:methionyl-tRNA formyltransferase
MTKISAPIVFFGNERLATGFVTSAPTLTGLIEAGYTVAAVVTNYEAGKSRSVRELEVAAVAQAHNIPVIVNEKPGDIIDQLRSFNAAAGVLVAYGQIVPQRVIDIFPHGIINIHPSLLPLHRGPTPIESAILNGESQTGVSLMQLSKAMDAGPVYAQQTIPLTGNETKQALTEKLLQIGSKMLIKQLPSILSDTATATPQQDTDATYDQRITKEDGIIDWNKPAARIEREIRAYADWPKSRTTFGNLEVVITKAHITAEAAADSISGTPSIIGKQPAIQCGDQLLVIDLLKPAGKKEMTGEAFLAGYKRYFI